MAGDLAQDLPRRATSRLAVGRSQPAELAEWRGVGAYVLLAEPGAGKTRAFKAEARATGSRYLTARDFAVLQPAARGIDTVWFIDALDEMRADAATWNGPLDAIRQGLVALGCPRFRLACREADWIGAADTEALRAVAPAGDLAELRLEPLNRDETLTLLRLWPDRVPDAQAFWQQAQQLNLAPLLANPLLLELLVDAVRGADWPETRRETYQLACERMAAEYNPVHRAAKRGSAPPRDDLLADAGLWCAALLLAGAEAITMDATGSQTTTDIPTDAIASRLALPSPSTVLASKLFLADGERRLPRHRTVAEYLAAQAVARRVAGGLPISRVLALMGGFDGGIVEPLRGLHAWLAVHCPSERALLIDRDPLGVVLYGDVRHFETREKRQILAALAREAQRFAGFRRGDWTAHPFGALGSTDMGSTLKELLVSPDRSPAHQALVDCVLDAVRYGAPLPALKPALEAVLRDGSWLDGVRSAALQAWLAQSQADLAPARAWLDDIAAGAIEDPRGGFCVQLLDALYPTQLGPDEVMRYFRVSDAKNWSFACRRFWDNDLLARTAPSSHAVLADQLAALPMDSSNLNGVFGLSSIISKIITAALEAAGEHAGSQRLNGWLRAGLDKYGFVALKGPDGDGVHNWMNAHPAVQKSVFAYAATQVPPDPSTGQRHFWPCEQLLFQAKRPADWFNWLLEVAADTEDAAFARYCFDNAAHAALNPTLEFNISMDDVEKWINANSRRWPDAATWQELAWTLPLDHYQGQHQQRDRAYAAKALATRERRWDELLPQVDAIQSGTAPVGLMHQLALAYRGQFVDIHGDTPEARLQDYLGGSADVVGRAVNGLKACLRRTDLPTVDEILKLGFAQREHFIRPACLVGAELAFDESPVVALDWDDELARRLVAFWLTDGTGEQPRWYASLAQQRPILVAGVLGVYAAQHFRKRPDQSVPGLWTLSQSDDPQSLARAVVPGLLQRFPARANAGQLRQLNHDLLPAAVRHLDRTELAALATGRLGLKSLDSGQRIAWLVAALVMDPEARSRELLDFIGGSQTRALQLSAALDAQRGSGAEVPAWPAATLARLIQLLAPHSSPDYPTGAFWVGDAENCRELVHGFIRQLSAVHDESASAALADLRAMPALKLWAAALDSACAEQSRSLRAARFGHASARAVALTLTNLQPANASDLAALVCDHLQALGSYLRGDETNSIGLFWRDDRNTPKMENDCRDALLGLLRPRLLPLSVQTEKEASAANDTRADLRASTASEGRRVVVPIEIKKEDHRAVWTAWRDQLDGRYTTDPAAQGIGIYCVLWFGRKLPAHPEGLKPRSAAEMADALRALIPEIDRMRLTVVVLDLSQPPPASR